MKTLSDITFVNLPSPFLEDNLWIYPLGILNIATYTKSIGFKVDFLDLAPLVEKCTTDEELTEAIQASLNKVSSPIIGVSAVTPQYKYLSIVPRMVKGKIFIAGGIHPSIYPQETLQMGYSAVVVGEGEAVIDGVLRKPHGVYKSNKLVDVSDLPFPHRAWYKGYKGPTPLMAGRGCLFTCTFCARMDGAEQTRFRHPKGIVEELKQLSSDTVIFYDDTFTLNKRWTLELCEEIKKAGIKKNFRCSTRADRLTPEVLQALKMAGFTEVCVGVESGSQKILDILNKKTTVEQNTEAVARCREHGIKFKAFMMIGNAGESPDTIAETRQWIQQNRPDKLGFYIFNPLPGCAVWDKPGNFDIEYVKDGFDTCYYGGKKSVMESRVATSTLSRADITRHYNSFITEFSTLM